jgi:hypothetical protein
MVKRRIWVVATDGAGCFWYRLKTPLEALDSERFEVIWRGPAGHNDLRSGDVLIGQRIAADNAAWLEFCARTDILTVYDLDDNLLDIDPANAVPYSIYAPQVAGTAASIAAASVVTVSTSALADVVRLFNPSVAVLPNCLPDAWLEPCNIGPSDDGLIWIGWAGSMFHQQDWSPELVHELAELKADDSRIRYHMIGANYIGALADRFSPWATMDALHATLDFDLGIAPLGFSRFNESKSWIKALEYAGRGIPFLGSFVGQYPDWLDGNGHSGARAGELVAEGESWYRALRWMTSSTAPTLVQRAEAAYELAHKWTISQQIHRWTEVYER